MDFLDPKKKRAHSIRLVVGYVLIGIAIGLGSLILVSLAFGYNFDRKTGQLIQNGLVYISAQPESAKIYLNSEEQSNQTDTRINLPEGEYDLELRREGYHSWRRGFTLMGGRIERFVYPFLFPVDLVTRDMSLYASQPPLATASPDRQWLLVQVPGSFVDFDVFDMNDELQPPLRISLAPNLMTTIAGERSLKAIEWSTDNRHVLLEHGYPGGREFILVNHDRPEESVNLSRVFGRTPSTVTLRDKRYDRYYFHDKESKVLEVADLKTRIVAPFINDVLAFKTHDEQYVVFATGTDAPEGKVQIKVRDDDGIYPLRDVNPADKYLLDMARFESKWYVIAGSQAEGKAYVYRDPFSHIKKDDTKSLPIAAILRADSAHDVSFSQNARFVMIRGGQQFAVHDMETQRSYRYEISKPLSVEASVKWMDGHRMVAASEGRTIVFDYDGINLQTLSPVSDASGIFFDRDYTGVYNVAPSTAVSGRSAITRTELIVED